MNDVVSRDTSSTAASQAGLQHSALKGSHLPAGPLLGDYPRPASPHHAEPHRNGTSAPRWRAWPKRCERALRRYLTSQEDHSFPLDLARVEVKQMAGTGRSTVTSSVQRSASAAA